VRSLNDMLHVVLFEPEIPPNTGNIIRLCANAGARLHLIKPLGFTLNQKSVQRAGLDYSELAEVSTWSTLDECFNASRFARWFAMTTKASRNYGEVQFSAGDAFVFGPETRGLPAQVLARCPQEQHLRIPMQLGSRSINLSNSVAIVLYEAWRQLGFEGGV
jgi:tRNA (cytidine/uridine-2'-O-)-methyltransferase